MWLFGLFVAVPLIEIALFIQVGGAIGLWPTLAIVVATAIGGTWLMRQQGLQALSNIRRSLGEMTDPSEPLAHGAMILVAGAMLLTPGFFTDSVGFLLLVPGVRTRVFKWLRARVRVQSFSDVSPQSDIIDGDYEEIPREANKNSGPSPWREH